jgi:hypothetical protein
VADRVVVLRLGRNNGVYNVAEVTSEMLIAAITGAADNSAGRTAAERSVTSASPTEAPVEGEPADDDGPAAEIIRMPRSRPRRPSTPKDGRP